MNIDIEQLRQLVEERGCVFVFGCRAPWFWPREIQAYPFREGALVVRTVEDEYRWPGAFLTAITDGVFTLHDQLPGDRAAAFRDRWLFHLAGIVEYAPVPIMTLPPWSFPPDFA
jgi:hypothetical protein